MWATGEAFNCVKWRINSLFTFEEARDHDSNGSFRSFKMEKRTNVRANHRILLASLTLYI